ncbi:MAG: B12-binding domain-containing radical SAM protein [bacterium]
MKKKCLLISPPGELDIFPRGIMEIATFLNHHGCPTSVLPLGHYYLNMKTNFSLDESHFILDEIGDQALFDILKDAIREFDPNVVGVSNCYTIDYDHCIKIVRMCKQINPRIITVMGGHHVTFCDAESIQIPELDIVVRGEGEWIMRDLLRAVEEKRDLGGIQGITIKKNGEVHRNPPAPPGDLDEIPPVDFKLLPKDFVQISNIHSILNRGCAYKCIYCAEKKFWGLPRSYSNEKIVEEMKVLEKDYGTQVLGLHESMADLRSKRFFDLCECIQKNQVKLKKRFYFTTRIDSVTDEAIECMLKTNISMLAVGIENFSPKVLNMMNKRQSFDNILMGCEKSKKHRIWVHTYWIIGHPGDDINEADYSYNMFKDFFERDLIKSGNVFMFIPYPGTDCFNHPEKYGIRISSYDWKHWSRWSKERLVSCLENFSKDEIVAAYERARKMLEGYRIMNKILYPQYFI